MTTIAQGRVSGLVVTRWEASAEIAALADWFPSDIVPFQESRKRFALDDSFTVVKHTLQLFVPTATVVNIQYKFNGILKVLNLNDGAALTANSAFQFDLVLFPGASYNVRHITGSLNVAAIITESFNVDI